MCDDAGIPAVHPARDECVATAARKLRPQVVQAVIQQERVRLDGLDFVDSRARALGVANTVVGGSQTYSNADVAPPNLSVTCTPSRAPASRAFVCS